MKRPNADQPLLQWVAYADYLENSEEFWRLKYYALEKKVEELEGSKIIEIDFDGNLLALVEITGEIKFLKSMNGFGNPIDVSKIKQALNQ